MESEPFYITRRSPRAYCVYMLFYSHPASCCNYNWEFQSSMTRGSWFVELGIALWSGLCVAWDSESLPDMSLDEDVRDSLGHEMGLMRMLSHFGKISPTLTSPSWYES
jgi:hypothetical protein